jgi:hypothetical protein
MKYILVIRRVRNYYQRKKSMRSPSTSQFSCNSQELEIHEEKNFEGSHKKESLARWKFSKNLF